MLEGEAGRGSPVRRFEAGSSLWEYSVDCV